MTGLRSSVYGWRGFGGSHLARVRRRVVPTSDRVSRLVGLACCPFQDIIYFEAFVHESLLLSPNTPFVCPPPLHHPHYFALYCFPPDNLYCNICHARLEMSISCKGQIVHRSMAHLARSLYFTLCHARLEMSISCKGQIVYRFAAHLAPFIAIYALQDWKYQWSCKGQIVKRCVAHLARVQRLGHAL